MEKILEVKNIEKYYGNKSNLTKAIDNINFDVNKGEFVGIMGASGSGKTTLLNCISTIDRVTAGHIIINGKDITKLKGNNLNKFRREELGFIFQDFNLLDTLTAYENIALALTIQKVKANEIDRRVNEIAEKLGIKEILKKYPYQVSGGQKQRISIARAIARDPEIYIFDDSFSALDYKTDSVLRKELKKYTKDADILVVAVGKKYLIDKTMVKKDSVIIDVGINRIDGKLYGDVNPNVEEVCGYLTPVPGGVGPMTVSMLLKNTFEAYKNQNGIVDMFDLNQ